jgi:hypothetical protein
MPRANPHAVPNGGRPASRGGPRVQGWSGVTEEKIWLDRAEDGRPGWVGVLGWRTNTWLTETVGHSRGYYWWRTCIVDDGQYFCTAWYR